MAGIRGLAPALCRAPRRRARSRARPVSTRPTIAAGRAHRAGRDEDAAQAVGRAQSPLARPGPSVASSRANDRIGDGGRHRQSRRQGEARTMAVSIHPAVDQGVQRGTPELRRRDAGVQMRRTAGQGEDRAASPPTTTSAAAPSAGSREGALFSMVAVVPRDKLSVVENGDKLEIVDRSAAIQRYACRNCGVHMYGRIENQGAPVLRASTSSIPSCRRSSGWSAPSSPPSCRRSSNPAPSPSRWPTVRARLKEPRPRALRLPVAAADGRDRDPHRQGQGRPALTLADLARVRGRRRRRRLPAAGGG